MKKNIFEEIQRIQQMMGIITESNNSHKKLITESSEGKRCWYYKKIADGAYRSDKRVPDPFKGPEAVQEFLIKIGFNITKDGNFSDETAKALDSWAGIIQGVGSVNKLWTEMKKSGWDVGETYGGYNNQMHQSVASMILKKCESLSKTCKVDQQTLFDMDFKLVPKEESDAKSITIPAELNKSFKYAVDYWRKYLNNPKVKEKILANLFEVFKKMNPSSKSKTALPDTGPFSFDAIIGRYLNALDEVEKKGWIKKKNPKVSSASMYVSGDCPRYTVCVNVNIYYYYFTKGLETLKEKSKSTFVHEIQHILWKEVSKLNPTITIQQAFPSSYDYYGTEKKEIENRSSIETIPVDAKNELSSNGINHTDLINYYKYEDSGYNCDWNEKLSNLAAYRSYLDRKGLVKIGEDIPLSIITKDIKSTLKGDDKLNDLERMIGCWVMGNFKPKLSVFVKELNELAKNEIDSKDKNYNNLNVIDKTTDA